MSCDNIEGNEWPGINKEYTAQDMEFIEEALEYARTQHEMVNFSSILLCSGY